MWKSNCLRRNTAADWCRAFALTVLSFSSLTYAQITVADRDFNTSVPAPAYTREHPRVVLDEAHHNFHTMHGRYQPLAQLLERDGYQVDPGTAVFTRSFLQAIRVLVISNALGGDEDADAGKPAFAAEECDVVEAWVRDGGSLMLIADHAPFGSAAHDLALRFGVEMGEGFVFDMKDSAGDPTFLVYSAANGLLGEHPIIHGRNEAERVQRIVAFTGQSLSVPRGAVALMKLAPSAYEVGSYAAGLAAGEHDQNRAADAKSRAVGGRAQGVAVLYGRGRVVVVGEAALFSAQVLKISGQPDMRFGMNAPGNDDKQFALNAFHWLSGTIH
jgi:hypothetical protein